MTEKQEKTVQPKSPVSKVLIKAGSTAWILLAGLAVILFVLNLFGVVNIWQFPLKHIGIFLACGGLACFMISWILKVWRS
ncbi:hypothetical protein VB780_15580 [Leptolyngbya sp. CCNP1308]|uniref:hypothetical protein n=1 Tax=Leptolyngbya sp. CCNP1308 TaxID=3110255 RepID=UPI002B1FC0E6|nr:hypothetical protein [Leptolyngbya sp. CCNP1308]MEA5450001.1 hypothetical protein [Leptolyngbya sp. CCNP1308]